MRGSLKGNMQWGVLVLLAGSVIALGCSANSKANDYGSAKPDSGGGTGGSAGSEQDAGVIDSGSVDSEIITVDSAVEDVKSDIPVNQCGSSCGAVELCDPSHLGYDDNCNGAVDETCGCTPGLSHWCFKGDPASRNKGTCKDGTEKCSEMGDWGNCSGGFHADSKDNCLNQGTITGCHDLSVPPFSNVNLKDGTGTFGAGATGENFVVECPSSIPNCPAVQNASSASASFTPLQSGQYKVTYTKDGAGGKKETCAFGIYVGATGLRVELNWDHQGEGTHAEDPDAGISGNGPDLDLHVHRPGTKTVWFAGPLMMKTDDCFYGNCTYANFVMPGMPGTPVWFLPDAYPHNWTYKTPYNANDPIYTCYSAPRGVGKEWKFFNKGCHNPRLDLDNIVCDKTKTDPQDSLFCAPENINIDEPPYGLWTRIGVHYFGLGYSGDLHPTVTVYCAGSQVAQFGPTGFDTPVTFPASGGKDQDNGDNSFWMVADVMAIQGPCGEIDCVVQPLYLPGTKKPNIVKASQAKAGYGPACPPAGDAGIGCY